MRVRRVAVVALVFVSVVACKRKSDVFAPDVPPAPARSAKEPERPANAVVETRASLDGLVADKERLYWVSGGYNGMPKGILTVPKTGGTAETLAPGKWNAVWVTDQHVYALDQSPELFSIERKGGAKTSFAKAGSLGPAAASGATFCWVGGKALEFLDAGSLPIAPIGSIGVKQVVDNREIFIWCRKDGAKESVKVAHGPILPGAFLVAGDEVFWSSSPEQIIEAAPIAGGRTRVVVKNVIGVQALAANKTAFFFVAGLESERGLYAMPWSGGTPKKLIELTEPVVKDLLADDENVYYAAKGGVWSIPAAGGAPTQLFEDGWKTKWMEPMGLVLDGDALFLAEGLFIRKLTARKKSEPPVDPGSPRSSPL